MSEIRMNVFEAGKEESPEPGINAAQRLSSRKTEKPRLYSVTIQGESVEDFESMLAAMIESRRPTDEIEMQLVEVMAVCKWRQLRFWQMVSAAHTRKIQDQINKCSTCNGTDCVCRQFRKPAELCKQCQGGKAVDFTYTSFPDNSFSGKVTVCTPGGGDHKIRNHQNYRLHARRYPAT